MSTSVTQLVLFLLNIVNYQQSFAVNFHGFLNRRSEVWGRPTDVCVANFHGNSNQFYSSILRCNDNGVIQAYHYKNNDCSGDSTDTDTFRKAVDWNFGYYVHCHEMIDTSDTEIPYVLTRVYKADYVNNISNISSASLAENGGRYAYAADGTICQLSGNSMKYRSHSIVINTCVESTVDGFSYAVSCTNDSLRISQYNNSECTESGYQSDYEQLEGCTTREASEYIEDNTQKMAPFYLEIVHCSHPEESQAPFKMRIRSHCCSMCIILLLLFVSNLYS